MKKHIICLLSLLLLVALLTGCDGLGSGSTEGGILYLNADCSISITFDENGNVVSINAESENAKEIVEAYKYLSGTSCTQVIGELVELIGEAGYLPEDGSINIRFDENATLPEGLSQESIKTEIQNVMDANNWEGSVSVDIPENSNNSTESEATSESENGTDKIPEGATLQSDGTYIYTIYTNRINEEVPKEDASCICIYIYDAEGNLIIEDNRFLENDIPRSYTEYYTNGIVKSNKRWESNGVLIREFTSFHDGDAINGILCEYDRTTGKLLFRTTEGNPDGSGATFESWTEENNGEYVTFVYDSPYSVVFDENGAIIQEAKLIEERYERSNLSVYISYDYDTNRRHVIHHTPEGVCTFNMIMDLTGEEYIEGWTETTYEDGSYRREEWKDGKRSALVEDGANYMGFTVKNTSTYYDNGQVKSFERYFYIDGGHYYAEFDEEGNEIFLEITTNYY